MNKKLKLIVSTTLSLIMSIGLIGCSSTSKNDNVGDETLKIGVVLGEGGANDQSFNQSSLEGFNRAKENLGVGGSYLESNQQADYKPNIETFVDNEVDLIIGGPPCQSFSTLGRARDKNGMKNDPRNFLFESYI